MSTCLRHLAGIAVVAFAAALSGCGTTPATREATSRQVLVANATLNAFRDDPEMQEFRDYLRQAKAVIISPRVTKAGYFVGGSGGEALVMARDKSGLWHGPAFYNLGGGSLGFQMGVEVSEVAILVMSDRALEALLHTSLRLGVDASIAAGRKGVGGGATIVPDTLSFARNKGAYAGFTLDGAVLAPDRAANRAFYGRVASPVDILVRENLDTPAAAPLIDSLQRLVR